MLIFIIQLLAVLASLVSGLDFNWGSIQDRGHDWSGFLKKDDFLVFTGYTYEEKSVSSLIECQEFCEAKYGCSFVVYRSISGICQVKLVDQTSYMKTVFTGQSNSNFLWGEVRATAFPNIADIGTSTATLDECIQKCTNNAACHVATHDTALGSSKCTMKSFPYQAGSIISFRTNPKGQNDNPMTEGTISRAGNTNIVAIAAILVPGDIGISGVGSGKVLLGARPEVYRPGGINTDNVLSGSPIYSGEIAALYDPISESSRPIHVSDNLFCHGAALDVDGNVFTAGGDALAYGGLTSGINSMRSFSKDTETYDLGAKMRKNRWYPTVFRTPDKEMWIIGGQEDAGKWILNDSLEVTSSYKTVSSQLYDAPIIRDSWQTNYPKVTIIPGSGNVFFFLQNVYSIMNKDTKQEIESTRTSGQRFYGLRGGDYIGAGCLLPMYATENINDVKGEFIVFGGGLIDYYSNPEGSQDTISSVERMVISDTNSRVITTDDPMPYGRVQSEAVLQPNGKILIVNGGRYGRSSGSVPQPNQHGAASEIFCYDGTKPSGQRWEVFGKFEHRRFYHSAALLLPDGTTVVMGTDQATYDVSTTYNHEAEKFLPPWLQPSVAINRPVFTNSPTDVIYYGTEFTVDFDPTKGIPDRVSMLTPMSSTHATEMSTRLLFLIIVRKDTNRLLLRAPLDATIMLHGYQMLFLLNGDTPSIAAWVKLDDAPSGYVFPPLTTIEGGLNPIPGPVASPVQAPFTPPEVTFFSFGEQCHGDLVGGWAQMNHFCDPFDDLYCHKVDETYSDCRRCSVSWTGPGVCPKFGYTEVPTAVPTVVPTNAPFSVTPPANVNFLNEWDRCTSAMWTTDDVCDPNKNLFCLQQNDWWSSCRSCQYYTGEGACPKAVLSNAEVPTAKPTTALPTLATPTTVPTLPPTTEPTVKATATVSPTASPTSLRTTLPTNSPIVVPDGPRANKWSQCGGKGYTGPTVCVEGCTCVYSNEWWSMCE